MIVAPPLDAGAVQATVTEVVLTTVTVPIVGAPGTAAGVTALEALDKPDVPAELVAVALKKYDVPFVKPLTIHEPDAPVTVQPVEYVPPEVVDTVTV